MTWFDLALDFSGTKWRRRRAGLGRAAAAETAEKVLTAKSTGVRVWFRNLAMVATVATVAAAAPAAAAATGGAMGVRLIYVGPSKPAWISLRG